MDHLSPAELAELRAMIEARLAALVGLLSSDGSRTAELRVGETAGPAGDLQDRAARERERTVAMEAQRRAEVELGMHRAALARMAAGTYGVCEESGEPIPLARLRRAPTTRYLAEVQAELEREDRRDRRQDPDDDLY